MTSDVLLAGLLADARMLAVFGLAGRAETLPGRLEGGGRAGIDRDGWPMLVPGQGTVPAMRVTPNAALQRYAEVMALAPQHHGQGRVLGLGCGGAGGEPDVELAAAIARRILAMPEDRPADSIAGRLPAMGIWAASQLRAARGPVSGGDVVGRRGPGDVQILRQEEAFAGFFSVKVSELRHRTHAGGMAPVLRRETLILGDAVVLLPWDPIRDRVLLIEQVRMAPLFRRDPQPWLLEPIAGRVDAGETVEDAAHREAREEANLSVSRLFPAIHHYPSPGVLGEYLYLYVGIADLPDGVEGVHGLETEAEDIRGHLIDRAGLTRMALAGQLTNGPLAMMALWLELRHGAIRTELGLG